MKVVLFGGSGMIGQGVFRECLRDPDVERVVSVVRKETGTRNPKLREVVHGDFSDFSPIEPELAGADACLFTLGVTSAGMSEEDYRRVTYDIAIAAAKTFLRLNPGSTFAFVSGAGTDSTERGRTMWARVKGATENALLAMPFRAAYMFRPAAIQPLHGIRSRTRIYRIFYAILGPVLPLMRRLFPQYVTTTEHLGRAMIEAARRGAPKRILESSDINMLGEKRS
ncbi:MAG TPA: NAD(P)H-binding protein [Thermoanaerobaculia bacterium]|nr:NAD(P)H-binding protein [Thermoanaerobaculia bacterium]